METLFFSWLDEESGLNFVAFATEVEIENDCLTGEWIDDFTLIASMKELLEDDGSLCEDYLISTDVPLNVIDEELEKRGFIKDKRIKNIGWG